MACGNNTQNINNNVLPKNTIYDLLKRIDQMQKEVIINIVL